ncbi:MAG: DNA cytosine methyltransferase [Bacilli bacterium]|jgi:DNA (cytosine-5)-methyltransferase 1|nr:DNA cytosine methyltransferase [Bacilli bacterium]
MQQKKIRVVDLFSGCGGMSLGFQEAGFDVVAAYDNWDPAIEVYKRNFDHPIIKKDLFDADSASDIAKHKPEIIIGGPPCQDFSIAGKRHIGKRANLTLRFAEIVSEIKPAVFVMENVYNIEKMPILPKAIAVLQNAGYQIEKTVLDASYCGAPQKRHRFIMIGYLKAPSKTVVSVMKERFSKKAMTVRDYLGDSLGTEFYYMHPRSYKRRAVFSVDEPASTIRGVNRPMPENYHFHPADKCKDKSQIRSLTSKERSLIQTFPQDFVFEGNKSDVEQMIGNAVPVELAHFVGGVVKACFYDKR